MSRHLFSRYILINAFSGDFVIKWKYSIGFQIRTGNGIRDLTKDLNRFTIFFGIVDFESVAADRILEEHRFPRVSQRRYRPASRRQRERTFPCSPIPSTWICTMVSVYLP